MQPLQPSPIPSRVHSSRELDAIVGLALTPKGSNAEHRHLTPGPNPHTTALPCEKWHHCSSHTLTIVLLVQGLFGIPFFFLQNPRYQAVIHIFFFSITLVITYVPHSAKRRISIELHQSIFKADMQGLFVGNNLEQVAGSNYRLHILPKQHLRT